MPRKGNMNETMKVASGWFKLLSYSFHKELAKWCLFGDINIQRPGHRALSPTMLIGKNEPSLADLLSVLVVHSYTVGDKEYYTELSILQGYIPIVFNITWNMWPMGLEYRYNEQFIIMLLSVYLNDKVIREETLCLSHSFFVGVIPMCHKHKHD